jgi:hypothetical protein
MDQTMSMTPDEFTEGAKAIAKANNIDLDTALEYQSLIGDTPELCDDGRVVVRDRETGAEITRIIFPEEE